MSASSTKRAWPGVPPDELDKWGEYPDDHSPAAEMARLRREVEYLRAEVKLLKKKRR